MKATPQEYEKWGKGFFKELQEKDKECRKFVGEKAITRISIKEILDEKEN